jgi:tripartite-type tricarboxylate transporter receptor subunit TctC
MKTSLLRTTKPEHPSQPRRDRRPRPKIPSSGQHPRRRFLGLAAGAAALPVVSRIARAQSYPTRPLTMIVPFAPGSNLDVLGRILAERMKATLGQAIIIENVSGADGSIGLRLAARAKPDGYTIDLAAIGQHVLNGALYSLPYDVLNDFAPISPLTTTPLVLFGRKTLPLKDIHELVAWLKTNPDKVSAGSYAAASRLLTAFFQKQTATKFSRVSYRGSAPAVQDLVAGHIDLLFTTPDQLPLVQAGSIKAYAVTGDTRLALAPDIPTFSEMGLPVLSYLSWDALFAPKGTPRGVISRLNAAAVEALADPTVQSRLADLGRATFPREKQTPEALGEMVKADAEKWWPVIKEFGIKAE